MEWLARVFDSPNSDRVGLYVPGPSGVLAEFDVDLDELGDLAAEYGTVATRRLYLDEHAPPELIQAGEARGYDVVSTSGDVDVRLGVDATAASVNRSIGVLVVVSRDTDFKPVLERAAREGVRTVAVAPGEYGRSDALQNAAQESLTL